MPFSFSASPGMAKMDPDAVTVLVVITSSVLLKSVQLGSVSLKSPVRRKVLISDADVVAVQTVVVQHAVVPGEPQDDPAARR